MGVAKAKIPSGGLKHTTHVFGPQLTIGRVAKAKIPSGGLKPDGGFLQPSTFQSSKSKNPLRGTETVHASLATIKSYWCSKSKNPLRGTETGLCLHQVEDLVRRSKSKNPLRGTETSREWSRLTPWSCQVAKAKIPSGGLKLLLHCQQLNYSIR